MISAPAPGDRRGMFSDALRDGRLELPLPGHGRTAERLLRLAGLGRADLVLARLGEGHANAIAIRAELGDTVSVRFPGASPCKIAQFEGEKRTLNGHQAHACP